MVVAPALAYGSSGEHAGVRRARSRSAPRPPSCVLVELCRSAGAAFERVVVISTHGGNAAPLRAALARLRAEGRDVRAFTPRWGGDAHAGRTETSLMLAIAPELVRPERGERRGTPSRSPSCCRGCGPRVCGRVAANGVLGDPAGASAEEGERLLDGAVAELRAMVAPGVPA